RRGDHGTDREKHRSALPGAHRVQPVDAVRGVSQIHERREGGQAARRYYARALARRDLGQGQGVGCRDRRAGARSAHRLARVKLATEYDPKGALENAGDALGIFSKRVQTTIEPFKDFIEKRGAETGG